MQWNLSNDPDTSGTEESVHIISEVSLFQSMQELFLGKGFLFREVSSFHGCP